jgi:hypothetical protein
VVGATPASVALPPLLEAEAPPDVPLDAPVEPPLDPLPEPLLDPLLEVAPAPPLEPLEDPLLPPLLLLLLVAVAPVRAPSCASVPLNSSRSVASEMPLTVPVSESCQNVHVAHSCGTPGLVTP